MEPVAGHPPPSGIRRLAALATYASSVGVALLGLANVLVVSRALGPSGRGEVAFLTAVASISGYLSNLSVHESNANRASEGSAIRRALGSNSLIIAGGLGIVGIVVAVGALEGLPFLAKDVSPIHLVIALASIPAVTLQTYLVYLARGAYHFAAANVALLVGPTVALLTNLIMFGFGRLSVTSALVAWTSANFVSAALLALHHGVKTGYGRPDAALAKGSIAFGAQSHIGGIFATGSYSLDQWVLGASAGSRDLGLYSVAVAWFQGLFLLPTAISVVSRPDLVRLSETEVGAYAARVFRLTLLSTFALAVIVFFAAPMLCGVIFGSAFGDAATPLRILAPGAIGVCTVKMLGTVLIAQRKPLLESAAMGIGFVVAVGLYLTLIPAYGGIGAAVASTLAYTAAGAAAVVLLTRSLPVRAVDLIPRPSDARRLVRIAVRRGLN